MRPPGHIVHEVNTAYEITGRPSDSLRFAVLGPVRAWQGERELDLGSPQQRAVLATLLSRRGRPVTVGELVGAVWGEEPPTAAVSVLRTYVSRLRKVLEPGRAAGSPPRVVVSVADGYLGRVPEGALDLGVFEVRLTEAKKLRAAGDVSAAAELLHTALGEWEGTPLAGLPGPLAEAERSRLHEERLNTLETRLEIDVQLGRHSEVIAELTSLTGEYPLREQLCRLLMLALYRSGRQAEALAAYRRTRRILVTELGIEPGAPLRELHDRILAADKSLVPSPTARETDPLEAPADLPEWTRQYSSASADTAARPAQLPADLTAFTGRRAELEQTRALLPVDGRKPSTVVISAIDGMAAIGKTTLAVHWANRIAHRFPDGQLFINLRGFDPVAQIMPPGEAIRTFLDAFDVPPQRIPVGPDAQVALYRTLLAHRRVLILLDNARDIDQVRPLLPGSSGSLVIVTSRNELTGLVVGDGAHPLTLNPLTFAEAHGFLAKRLGAERLAAEPRLDKAVEYIRRGMTIFRIIGSAWSEGIALSNLGDVYQRLGRFDDAIDCLERALTVLRGMGNRWVEGVTLDVLGTVHHRLHRYDDAIETYLQAFEAHRDVGNRWAEGHTLGHVGDTYLASGRPKAARTSWRLALAILEKFGHPEAEEVQEKLGSLDERPPGRQPDPRISGEEDSATES